MGTCGFPARIALSAIHPPQGEGKGIWNIEAVMDVGDEDDGWGMPLPRPDPEAVRPEGARPQVSWSAAVGAEIVRRLAAGESLRAICAGAGMPHRSGVRNWARARPDFGRELAAAARAARLRRRRAQLEWAMRPKDPRGKLSTYTHEAGAAICLRLIAGETLIAICRDEGMPKYATVMSWLRRVPEFAEIYAEARAMAADYLFDEAREVARGATPGTLGRDRLRFDVIRWQAARIAPKKYAERVLGIEEIETLRIARAEAVAAAKRAPQARIVLHRNFFAEKDSEGTMRVVTYTPDPENNRVLRRVSGGPDDTGEDEPV